MLFLKFQMFLNFHMFFLIPDLLKRQAKIPDVSEKIPDGWQYCYCNRNASVVSLSTYIKDGEFGWAFLLGFLSRWSDHHRTILSHFLRWFHFILYVKSHDQLTETSKVYGKPT